MTTAEPDLPDGSCLSVNNKNDLMAGSSASSDAEPDAGQGDNPSNELNVTQDFRSYSGPHVYRMGAERRGICLVINNVNYENKDLIRKGGDRDGSALISVFRQLNFEVHYHMDQTAHEMDKLFIDFALLDEHRTADCFVCVVLAHGGPGNSISGIDDMWLSIDTNLLQRFNNESCPALAHKPKLFFIQACRGEKRDIGVQLQNVADGHDFISPLERQVMTVTIPTWSDLLVCYATIDGYVALRNEVSGSWFVDAFIRVLCKHACDTELLDLLKKVNIMLMEREGTSKLKQSLEIVLRGWSRSLYFNPGHIDV